MAEVGKVVTKQGVKTVKKPDTFWRRYRATVFQVYLIGAVLVFLVLTVLAKSAAYFSFDLTITHAVQTINLPWFAALMFGLSWLGFAPQTWVITTAVIVFLFLIGLKWETVVALVSVIGDSLLGLAVKVIVGRPRPAADLVTVVNQLPDYSFPSGHVLYFTTFVGFLFFLAFTLVKPVWWRTVLLILLGSMVALIGLSRVYEGQHWASDVIASYLLGSVWLSLSVLIYRWGKPRYFTRPEASPGPAAGDTGEPAHSSSYRG